MMAEITGNDFLGEYRNILTKLKKRFLRKPNVAEASDQFASLSKQLQHEGLPHYAGFCCLAVARCEQTLGNGGGEVSAWIEAARLYLQADVERERCPNYEEHLQAAICCFHQAIHLYIEQKQFALAGSLCLQFANSLKQMKQFAEAIGFYQKAAELQSSSPLDYLHTVGILASCKIEMGDFEGALEHFTEMSILAEEHGGNPLLGVYSDILARCEIMQVLLILILEPSPLRVPPVLNQVLERYTWMEEVQSVPYLSGDLFLLMQSLVMAVQARDIEAIVSLETELWNHLSPEELDLLRILVQKIKNSV